MRETVFDPLDEGLEGRAPAESSFGTALAPLRGQAASRLEQSRSSTGAGVLPLGRLLGEKLGGKPAGIKPIEQSREITEYPARPRRPDLWPPEVWAEMEAIRKGERP